MDLGIYFTIIGSAAAVVGLTYSIIINFKNDFSTKFAHMESKFELLDNRIFHLAMGKTLKDILLEEKQKETKIE